MRGHRLFEENRVALGGGKHRLGPVGTFFRPDMNRLNQPEVVATGTNTESEEDKNRGAAGQGQGKGRGRQPGPAGKKIHFEETLISLPNDVTRQ